MFVKKIEKQTRRGDDMFVKKNRETDCGLTP
jgi:hypothetical protein